MRLLLKFKAGATAAGVIADIAAMLTSGSAVSTSAHVDGNTSSVSGTYKPRFAVSGAILFMELENGGVVSLSMGTTVSLVLKAYYNFDWTNLTGTTSTAVYENSAVNQAYNSACLSLTTTTTVVLHVGRRSIFLSGTGAYGGTTNYAPYISHGWFLAAEAPTDETRFDGVTTPKVLTHCWAGTLSDRRYSSNGSPPGVSNEGGLVVIGTPTGGSVSSNTGEVRSSMCPVVSVAPGGMVSDLAGEVVLLQGRRALGETYEAGTRQWRVSFFGHAYSGYTDFWSAHSIATEVL